MSRTRGYIHLRVQARTEAKVALAHGQPKPILMPENREQRVVFQHLNKGFTSAIVLQLLLTIRRDTSPINSEVVPWEYFNH